MNTNNSVRICIPICETSVEALKHSAGQAPSLADMIELRLDCLEPGELDQLTKSRVSDLTTRHAIVTFRPATQGGKHELDLESRYEFWRRLLPWANSTFIDLELDLIEEMPPAPESAASLTDWTRVIASHHDFDCIPDDLDQIYYRLLQSPAGIVKIAVQARDVTDCIPVFGLLDRAVADNRRIIAVAMGASGIATRILGPSRGAFLTYGALDFDRGTAPGQISAGELKNLYRIDKITRDTQIFGLVGLPVAHSISPQIHNAAFAGTDFNGVYIPFEVHDLASFIKRMVHPATREVDWNIRGLSVTAPHKSAVMDYLDWIDDSAREIGAVNTLVVESDRLRGYNTDEGAFIYALVQKAGDLQGTRCAVIGAGGAASAALWGLRRKQARVTIYARDTQKAMTLAERFDADWDPLNEASFDGFDVVINATTLGTSGPLENETPATADQLRGARFAYDLVYNPFETRFLREARKAGCEASGGLGMLIAQAAQQFKLWTNLEAPVVEMKNAANLALHRQEV